MYLIGRLKDDVTPAQAQADLDVDDRAVARPERQQTLSGAARPERPRRAHAADAIDEDRHGRQHRDGAVGAAGGRRLRAADRLRQPGEPDPRPRRIAAEGVRHPRGAGGRALAPAQAVPHRRRAAVARRRRARRCDRLRRRCARCSPPMPTAFRARSKISLDWKVLLFTLAVSILTGIIFGMAPLLHLREQVVNDHAEGRRAACDRRRGARRACAAGWSWPKSRSPSFSSSARDC